MAALPLLDECSLCGCNSSACDPREEPAHTEAEIDEIERQWEALRR
ncbi:hypothetical protein M0R72_20605 [Candidatus Pacearchaeota archaeon]|jgi:hypothetical protein|nr:hypothetical protein [Candidatus Pacearchaeota archaeon]